jgi:hypothetical protein
MTIYFVIDFRTKDVFDNLDRETAIKMCENNPHRIFEQYY